VRWPEARCAVPEARANSSRLVPGTAGWLGGDIYKCVRAGSMRDAVELTSRSCSACRRLCAEPSTFVSALQSPQTVALGPDVLFCLLIRSAGVAVAVYHLWPHHGHARPRCVFALSLVHQRPADGRRSRCSHRRTAALLRRRRIQVGRRRRRGRVGRRAGRYQGKRDG
jgi:hypothetical protein